MKLVAGRRMLKRNQVRGFTQTRNWDEKTHVGKYPTDDVSQKR